MLEPILDDLNKLFKTFETAIIVIVAVILTFWVARCTASKAAVTAERVKVLTHEIKVTDTLYVRDTIVAHRTKTRYDSVRVTDTVSRNDTVFVPRAVADTAINACTQALHDCDRIRLLNDSLTVQLRKEKPGFWSRIGCTVGPSVLATRDGTVKAGIGAACGIRAWP